MKNKQEIRQAVKKQIEKEQAGLEGQGKEHDPTGSPYFVKNGRWCRTKIARDGGENTIPMSNFTAKITQENIIDDGKETTIFFTIEGVLLGKKALPTIEIESRLFPGMTWLAQWGSRARLEPGQTVKDYVRHAIQTASNDTTTFSTHYGHLGWRKIAGEIVYLHAGGAIGGAGGVSVRLSKELERFRLPPYPPNKPENAEAARRGLQASLDFLNIGSLNVTLPLFCLVYLSPLTTLLSPQPNFSLYLHGLSGTYKSTLAILALCHFGPFSGVESLSNFSDTVGILEKRAFTLKDSLHVIDDYHPASNKRNADNMESTAQKLIRGYSNRTARGRLNTDTTEKGRYEPRGMMLMTAEELPTLESTLARVCVVSVEQDSVDRDKLTALQGEAAFLPYAMAAYVDWIRKNMTSILYEFPKEFQELRLRAANEGFHRKLPEQAAFMGYALETATSFFYENKMMTREEVEEVIGKGWNIFRELAAKQQQRIADDNPIDRFFDIIATLIHQGKVKLEPLPPCTEETKGSGERIGFFNDHALYLLPTAAWHTVQAFCLKENSHFPFGKNTFFQMLQSKKIIEPSIKGESTQFVKVLGKAFRVLKIINEGIFRKTVTSVTD
ncbi:hypothetical protein SAMN04489760_1507 [Syntrophus gentianae]|uniref:DUF927 domain-containing protein n=1 Tax=Syntrophus gentianae TaxID=43775 RepID=A0A1H8BEL7_9BACT|nr:hypothetical protein [Syntrophus gentianae]SEM80448.1 hypothetical protein SAMN04489760_1507 [Syntrophus gentianae]